MTAAHQLIITTINSSTLMDINLDSASLERYLTVRLTTSLGYTICHKNNNSVDHPPPSSKHESPAVDAVGIRGIRNAIGASHDTPEPHLR